MREVVKNSVAKKLVSVFLASFLLATTLGACSSPDAREAGAIEPTPDGLFSKGVRVCVTNNSDKMVKIREWKADTKDSLSNNVLAVGATACGEGTQNWSFWDTSFLVQWRDNTTKSLYFGNQMVGYPFVTENPERRTADDGQCGISMKGPLSQDVGVAVPCSKTFSVGDTRGFVHQAAVEHLVNVTRLKDTNWIEYQVNVMR